MRRLLWLIALALLSLGADRCRICATGERIGPDGLCTCLPGHVPDTDGTKGCHVEASPAPSPTPAPSPDPSPSPGASQPPAPTPPPDPPSVPPTAAPSQHPGDCGAPLPPMPVRVTPPTCALEWATMADGSRLCLARSTCLDERCIDPANGASCRPLAGFAWLNLRPIDGGAGHWIVRDGYLYDGGRGWIDAYGRTWNDDWTPKQGTVAGTWEWSGICAPAVAAPCPSGACNLPAMPECAAPGDASSGVYGCCRVVSQHPAWTGPARFAAQVDAALAAQVAAQGSAQVFDPAWPDVRKEQAEDAFVAAVAARLRAAGLCATTHRETPGGGSADEIGVKDSQDRSEQYDVVLSNGRVRTGGYVAACIPARF